MVGSGACRGLRADGARTGPAALGAAKDASWRADPTVTLLPSPRTAPMAGMLTLPRPRSLQFTQ